MKNVNNNLIFTLGILGFIALNIFFLLPNQTNAYIRDAAYNTNAAYTICDGCSYNSNNNSNSKPSTIATPVIYSLDPTNTEVNSGIRTITILGTGFRPDSIARWNSSDRPTSYINNKKLVMELDPNDITTPGQYLVTVVNPSPEGGKFSNPKVFTVNKKVGVVAGATTKVSTTSGLNKKPIKKTVVRTNPAKVAIVENYQDSCLTTATGSINDNNSDNSSFSASALNGGNSFMPNTIIGWLMLFVLIFLSVLIFRKLWITEADRNKPLKHA